MPEDKEANWISAASAMPDDDRLVETKIQTDSLGAWCLLKRRCREGVWCDEHWQPLQSDLPTHWYDHVLSCEHPLNKLMWYDESLHCFDCRTTWHGSFPHGLTPKVWGPVTVADLPLDYQI